MSIVCKYIAKVLLTYLLILFLQHTKEQLQAELQDRITHIAAMEQQQRRAVRNLNVALGMPNVMALGQPAAGQIADLSFFHTILIDVLGFIIVVVIVIYISNFYRNVFTDIVTI